MSNNRRDFLKTVAVVGAVGSLPASIARALSVPASRRSGTIKDVRHVVILVQENRSFDHYFGTLKGVRGFGDRHPVPMEGNKSVWWQSNGARPLPPFHLDTQTTNALKVPGTPHSFADAQAAWNQGKFGLWPKFKTDYSMGYYRREDIPFQFALAEAFTICDAYHCSVTSGTDPNRIVFWSGAGFDPELCAKGVNSQADRSEPDNLRCWIKGSLPEPGYTYSGNALTWKTIPEVLEDAGVDWRIYQDPNDNWTGAMHGGLAFEGFRNSKPGEPLYEKGMSHHSLEQLALDVREGTLPAVSWVLPPRRWSEHPSASSPIEGAEFTARVLDALTANEDVWSSTVFFQTFDENDGLFDHLPPAAPPSYNADGSLAGKATLPLDGHYFDDHEDRHTLRDDAISGRLRPFGLGPRVPMYVVSPWSKGGWVNSEVLDHTSVGQFIEKRFGVTIPGISPWHRAVCGDMTSCFDFSKDGDAAFPNLPDVANSVDTIARHQNQPRLLPPLTPQGLFQEPGLRRSRALPYVLAVDAAFMAESEKVELTFVNVGSAGAVFHVYDRLHLNRIPRRYTVEKGMQIVDVWSVEGGSGFDLWVLGPNGFLRHFTGELTTASLAPTMRIRQGGRRSQLDITLNNTGLANSQITLGSDTYGMVPLQQIAIAAGGMARAKWSTERSQDWYDFTLTANGMSVRAAGRIERGLHGISDPLMATIA